MVMIKWQREKRGCMAPDDDKEYRAILTAREREILSGEADVSDGYYYRVVSRVREKIEQLERDVAVLEEHHGDLASELRDSVCDN